jgi:Tfp pilus assembly protein PilN
MANFSTRPRREGFGRETWLVFGAALLLIVSGAGAARAWTQLSAAETTLAETLQQVSETRERVKELQSERATSGDDKLAAQLVLNTQAPPVAVLAALEAALPADVRLEAVTLTYEQEPEIEMRVVARRAAAYDEFLSRLAASAHFDAIEPGAETRDEALRAVVKAQFRAEAK